MEKSKVDLYKIGVCFLAALLLTGCGKTSDLVSGLADKYADTETAQETAQDTEDTWREPETDETADDPSEDTEASAEAEPVEKMDPQEAEAALKEVLVAKAGIGEDEIRIFHVDDFDEDGIYEAFSLVGSEPEYDFTDYGLVTGDLWYIQGDNCEKLTEGQGMGLVATDRIMDFGSRKYILFEEAYATAIITFAYYVDNGKAIETPFSGLGKINREEGSNDFTVTFDRYDAHYDPELGDMIGHTWKDYYFYYDPAAEKVYEYAGAEITKDMAKELAGTDIVAQCLGPDDRLQNILYRGNGVIHINYSLTDENGGIDYKHRTWKIDQGAFFGDFGEETDEEMGGTYQATICPEIAVYPQL
ncbi:MAG: hypothetical protein J5518_11290 [Lachnospiraceae bacterium]|nr:hypothetical protein [Lachnospiraceae bacterium]